MQIRRGEPKRARPTIHAPLRKAAAATGWRPQRQENEKSELERRTNSWKTSFPKSSQKMDVDENRRLLLTPVRPLRLSRVQLVTTIRGVNTPRTMAGPGSMLTKAQWENRCRPSPLLPLCHHRRTDSSPLSAHRCRHRHHGRCMVRVLHHLVAPRRQSLQVSAFPCRPCRNRKSWRAWCQSFWGHGCLSVV